MTTPGLGPIPASFGHTERCGHSMTLICERRGSLSYRVSPAAEQKSTYRFPRWRHQAGIMLCSYKDDPPSASCELAFEGNASTRLPSKVLSRSISLGPRVVRGRELLMQKQRRRYLASLANPPPTGSSVAEVRSYRRSVVLSFKAQRSSILHCISSPFARFPRTIAYQKRNLLRA
jgi:hypothetical protein